MAEKRYKCDFLLHGLNFEVENLFNCCMTAHSGDKNILPIQKIESGELNWDRVFELKRYLAEKMLEGKIPNQCKNCYYLKEAEADFSLDGEGYLSTIWLNHFSQCNSCCSYCYKVKNENETGYIKEYDVLTHFKYMFENNLLKNGGHIVFGGGEPTLLSCFEELLQLCFDNGIKRYIIHSSGIKYSQALAKGLKTKEIDLIISIDSATRETYKKIKKVDAFDKVCSNIKRYVQESGSTHTIKTKYIIIPGINDNFEEITKWYYMSVKDFGLKSIILDVEKYWFINNSDSIPPHIFELLKHIKNLAEKDGISLYYYEQALLLQSRMEE